MPDPERVSETTAGGFTEADVEAGARAIKSLKSTKSELGLLRDMARAVLDAVGSRSASAPTDEDAIRAVLRANGRPDTADALQADFEARREAAIEAWAPYVGHRKDAR